MAAPIESVKDYLARKLKEAGPSRYEAIANDTGVALSFIRKFVYGARDNPRVDTVQPLLDLFEAIERGERELPDLAEAKAA